MRSVLFDISKYLHVNLFFFYYGLSLLTLEYSILKYQVEYVFMGESQSNSYKKIIDEYRTASQCMEKFSGKKSSNFTILPKNQITNYFIQFRKVLVL